MKYLGIDYGTKKIGLAVSDTNGKIAFPHSIIATSDKEKEIEKVIVKEGIGEIVLGKSLDLKGQSNKVQEDINDFAGYIGMQFGLPVHFVKEFFSSSEARHATQNERQREKPVANPHRAGKKTSGKNAVGGENVDAKAAAIILQRHLDTIQLKNK
jgi:putative Holliday junction resolvase